MTNTNYKIVHLTERPCKMLDITSQCVQKYETYGEIQGTPYGQKKGIESTNSDIII